MTGTIKWTGMMTDRQIAQQLLDTITYSTRRNLVEVLEELQKSLLADPDLLFDWQNMQCSTWEDAISKIDAICQELKSL